MEEGKWLSLSDYARYRNKSISTIRRYIKANRVKFRDENGKYYIFASNYHAKKMREESEVLELKLEVSRLKKELKEALEERTELEMLVKVLEKRPIAPPSLPSIVENEKL